MSLHCNGCDRATQINLLRKVIYAMGNARKAHKRMFFKFQSVNTPMVKLFLEAFPTVPWIYVYRDPVEILQSQFKRGETVGTPPCARGFREGTADFGLASDADQVEYCAAKLGKYGDYILEALKTPGVGPGVVLNYKHLPDALVDVIVGRHFSYGEAGVSESATAKMRAQSHIYSKSRSIDTKEFKPDSQMKHDMASRHIEEMAEKHMMRSYKELESYEEEGRARLAALEPNAAYMHDHAAAAMHQEEGADANNDPNQAGSEPGGFIGGAQDIFHVRRQPGTKTVHWTKVRPSGLSKEKRNHILANVDVAQGEEYEHEVKDYIPFPDLVPLPDLLNRWPPDDPLPPDVPGIAEGSLPRFDFQDDAQRAKAKLLQTHEVPFMMYNVPDIDNVVEKWTDEYLLDAFGDLPQHVLKSSSNHFMYWNKQHARKQKDTYSPPTEPMVIQFNEFLKIRDTADTSPIDSEHVYLQLNSDANHKFIAQDLPCFRAKKSFWIVEAHKNRGINCRWGSRGLIAEAHYDGGRNFVAMLKGAKRYMLLPPSDCKNLYLWPKGHPEGRHARADWSNLDIDKYPDMQKAKATEVILRAGEVLYIPSYWFHYIISLTGSIQCNTRSGNAIRGRQDIKECGFY